MKTCDNLQAIVTRYSGFDHGIGLSIHSHILFTMADFCGSSCKNQINSLPDIMILMHWHYGLERHCPISPQCMIRWEFMSKSTPKSAQ